MCNTKNVGQQKKKHSVKYVCNAMEDDEDEYAFSLYENMKTGQVLAKIGGCTSRNDCRLWSKC